ncbi:hypothetical protein [Enterocloster sp.]|uniref:hypothetical protein n=1 Tax=Enterocloster sp. TaxID=2719315 RepID=UPI0039A378FE
MGNMIPPSGIIVASWHSDHLYGDERYAVPVLAAYVGISSGSSSSAHDHLFLL